MKTVNFITLGCKVNQYETDGMSQRLKAAGYQIVPEEEVADITVVNTCAVTNIAERKSRQMMRRVKKNNENAILIATGCYIQNLEDVLETLPEIDLFLGNNQKKDIVTLLQEYEWNHERAGRRFDINQTSEYEEFSIQADIAHTRAYIKIQDGCNQFCSYCIIPYVRGRVRSRDGEEIIAEVERLAGEGVKEIVLTGIHISSYGIDFEPKLSLLDLLKQLQRIDGLKRIRLGSLEPRIVTEEFSKSIAKLSKICPHFHLSLQSGCNETLIRMNRKYSAEEYKQSCEYLRKYYVHPAITTDVIVGFPKETESEFEETYRYLSDLQLYETHIFKYSIREGTNAAKMDGQIDGNIKHQRSERLLQLNEKNKKRFEADFFGRKEQILVEEEKWIDGRRYLVGCTSRYIKVALASSEDFALRDVLGALLNVRLLDCYVGDYLLADME